MQKKVFTWTGVFVAVTAAITLLLSVNAHSPAAQAEDDKVNITSLHWDYYVARQIQPTPSAPDSPPTPLEELKALVAKSAPVAVKAGWLLIKSTVDYDELTDNGSLPNGQPLPNHIRAENWIHLNDQLLIIECVTIGRTPDGQISQVAVFSNGMARNLTTGDSYPQEPLKFDLRDDVFLKDSQRYAALTHLERANVQLDGVSAIVFTRSEQYDKPKQGVGYKLPVKEARTRAYFDAVTGQLLLTETIFVTDDGVEHIASRGSQEIQLDVTPPAEVLNYLVIEESTK